MPNNFAYANAATQAPIGGSGNSQWLSLIGAGGGGDVAWRGDYRVGGTVRFAFTTVINGALTSLTASPAVAVYKDGGTTESSAGVTLTTDFDGRIGHNVVTINLAADATFYSAGSDFRVVLTAGQIKNLSAVGYEVASFSIENRSDLMVSTPIDGVRFDSVMAALMATILGQATVAGSTISFKLRDGSTTKVQVTVGTNPGERTGSTVS